MCVYCNISDWGRRNVWDPWKDNGVVLPPNTLPYVSEEDPAKEFAIILKDFLELVKEVKTLEEEVDPCPCPPDPKKTEWIEEAEDWLRDIAG
jgi:hypothetical protein